MFWDMVGKAVGSGMLGTVGDLMTGDQTFGGMLQTRLEDMIKNPKKGRMMANQMAQGQIFQPMDPMQTYRLQNPIEPYPVMTMFDMKNGGGQW